MINYVIIH